MPVLGSIIKRSLTIGNYFQNYKNAPAAVHQQRVLRQLILTAADTRFGEQYQFDKLQNYTDIAAAFADTVPAHDYNKMYDEWWHRSIQSEPDVTWTGVVKYFALSSGTSGAASKYIPVTKDMTKAMQNAGRKMFFSITKYPLPPELFTKSMMMVGGSADLNHENGFYCGDLSGINANRVPWWLQKYYKPGIDVARITDWNTRADEIAKRAAQWDIGFASGLPSWVQLMMERVIEYNKVDTIHDIWPNLSVFVSGGIALEPYKRGMQRLLSKPLLYLDSYLASEGFIAFQNRAEAENHAMAMILNNGIYYEFVPFNDANFDSEGNLLSNHKVLTINEVQAGVDYALLMSTCAGAWRYLIGDVVRFTDVERSEIHITGRTKHFLSITGEHLSVDNMVRGLELVSDELNAVVREFTVCAIETTPGQFEHRWYIGCDTQPDRARFEHLLDENLKKINDDYRTERSAFLSMSVQIVPATYFYEFQEKHARMDGQAKFPRVLRKEKFALWEGFVAAKKG